METALLSALVVVVAGLAVVVARRDGAPDIDGAVRAAVADTRAEAAAERDAAIQAALSQTFQATSVLSDQQQQALQAALEATHSLGESQRGAVEGAIKQALEASEALGRQQRTAVEEALEARTRAVGTELASVREQMAKMAEVMHELERQRSVQVGSIDAQLASLGSVTRSLTDVLASPKTRGQWGERTAEDLLRALGLREGIHFRRQTANAAGSIPDITFLLPDERLLHMDVKFPIDAYVRWTQAGSDEERTRHEQAFLRAVRDRVRELRGRDYIDPEAGTVDHVLCFVPNEAIYAFICERGTEVLDEAFAQKVVMCSPANLYALLSVIRQATEILQVERTSDEVLALLAAFDKQWSKFCEALDKVERNFGTVQKSFESLNGPRRRQLAKPLDQLDALRAQRGVAPALGFETGQDADVLPALRAVGDDEF